jgi:hypothetical protein
MWNRKTEYNDFDIFIGENEESRTCGVYFDIFSKKDVWVQKTKLSVPPYGINMTQKFFTDC